MSAVRNLQPQDVRTGFPSYAPASPSESTQQSRATPGGAEEGGVFGSLANLMTQIGAERQPSENAASGKNLRMQDLPAGKRDANAKSNLRQERRQINIPPLFESSESEKPSKEAGLFGSDANLAAQVDAELRPQDEAEQSDSEAGKARSEGRPSETKSEDADDLEHEQARAKELQEIFDPEKVDDTEAAGEDASSPNGKTVKQAGLFGSDANLAAQLDAELKPADEAEQSDTEAAKARSEKQVEEAKSEDADDVKREEARNKELQEIFNPEKISNTEKTNEDASSGNNRAVRNVGVPGSGTQSKSAVSIETFEVRGSDNALAEKPGRNAGQRAAAVADPDYAASSFATQSKLLVGHTLSRETVRAALRVANSIERRLPANGQLSSAEVKERDQAKLLVAKALELETLMEGAVGKSRLSDIEHVEAQDAAPAKVLKVRTSPDGPVGASLWNLMRRMHGNTALSASQIAIQFLNNARGEKVDKGYEMPVGFVRSSNMFWRVYA